MKRKVTLALAVLAVAALAGYKYRTLLSHCFAMPDSPLLSLERHLPPGRGQSFLEGRAFGSEDEFPFSV